MKALKYILLILILLCVFVFLVTIPGRKKEEERQQNETTASAVTTPTAGEDNGGAKPDNAETSGVIDAGGEPETPDTTTTAPTTTAPTVDISPDYTGIICAPETDNAEIDNNWAMFLVNQSHRLEGDFDIDTTVVEKGADGREFEVDSRMADYYLRMSADAKKAGAPIGVASAYRTIAYQQKNFDNNVAWRMEQGMTYEEAYADTAKNVALPGESEHNTGLAMDILSGEHWKFDEGFENTRAFRWLDEHAHEYGFILRYPKDKTGVTQINYEPWHYRFVGVYHATRIKESGLCLEEYIETLNPVPVTPSEQ